MRFSDRAEVDDLDGPDSFAEAANYMAVMSLGKLSPDRCAGLLSQLARAGLIVSVALHDEVCDEYAAVMQRLESDAS